MSSLGRVCATRQAAGIIKKAASTRLPVSDADVDGGESGTYSANAAAIASTHGDRGEPARRADHQPTSPSDASTAAVDRTTADDGKPVAIKPVAMHANDITTNAASATRSDSGAAPISSTRRTKRIDTVPASPQAPINSKRSRPSTR